jgi:hypothetical protein
MLFLRKIDVGLSGKAGGSPVAQRGVVEKDSYNTSSRRKS